MIKKYDERVERMINMSPRKNILLIATKRYNCIQKSDNGLKPQISPEELMQYIPR